MRFTLFARPGLAVDASPGHAALAGILLTIAACACFALLDTATKFVSASVPLFMALWLRYVFQSLITTAMVLPRHGLKVLRTRQPRFQLLRALLFASTSVCGFISLQFMPLAEFTAIVALTPVLVMAAAAIWLRLAVSRLRWTLLAMGLLGTLCIIRPGGSVLGWQLLMPLLMLVMGAAYQLLSSQMAGKEDPATTQFYTGWLATVLVSLGLPFAWTQITDPWVWAGTIAMGLASAAGHMLLLKAYARTTPAVLAPFLYTQIAFALLAGWLMHRHIPDGWAVLGMLMIALSGAACAWLTVRESR